MYKIIGTGSKGNALLYHDSILVDIGVPFSKIEKYQYKIQIVLLTHRHLDHINIETLKRLQGNRPTLRIGCGEWMLEILEGHQLRNIDVYKMGEIYNYGAFKISAFGLYHDVPNCGYRIYKNGLKIIHATDTAHLEGITAKGYDLYAIESNYNEDTVYQQIDELKARGEFAYQEGAINSHLSEQQARDFIHKNRASYSKIVRLHESSII